MNKRTIFLILFSIFSTISKAESAETLYCFDFGGAFQDVAPGYTPVSRVYHSPRYLWIDNVREVERMDVSDPLRRDFVGGPKGEFWIGLDNGDYQVAVILGDHREPKGPFNVYVQESLVRGGITLSAGEFIELTFPATVDEQLLKVTFIANDGAEFAVNALVLSGDPGKAVRRIFDNAPPDDLPPVDDVFRKGSTDTHTALKDICEWFLSHRLPNGFLGDYEPGARSTQYYWYTTAYPIRTLLAGYEIFNEQRYLDAVVGIMDDLVDEQLPNGAWQQIFRNKAAKDLTSEELDHIYKNEWMNLADIGSIATALGIAAHYAGPERKARYVNALKRFCEEWALQWQKPSGGFTNGMENGEPRTKIYSTATATEAAAFTALYANTGDRKHLEVAERAARFMTEKWNEDGRPVWHFHYTSKEGYILDMPIQYFGAAFYYTDGLFMVYHHTEDEALRTRIQEVYSWYINGQEGLLAHLGQDSWWGLQDAWNNSKTAGIPLACINYQRMTEDHAVNRFVSLAKRFLCTPEFSQRLGIMVEDADLPWGGHSLQSWAACSVSATGFAGLSIAEMIRPGIIYIKATAE
ncbi:MAG: hypothetical protein V2J62_08165 [candidate division KSB1 bacterium]|jgi:hypothetical protein|nr:hypothetical protein [candidate division KSB1 bacterium]